VSGEVGPPEFALPEASLALLEEAVGGAEAGGLDSHSIFIELLRYASRYAEGQGVAYCCVAYGLLNFFGEFYSSRHTAHHRRELTPPGEAVQ
jgi:hypothetical protein